MSFIYQHRKNDERYSLDEQEAWWVCITRTGLPNKRYRIGSKAEAEKELKERVMEIEAAKYGIILRNKLITEILNHYFETHSFKDRPRMANVIKYLKEPFEGIPYSKLDVPLYAIKRTQWRRRNGKNRQAPLKPHSTRTYEKIFRAAINGFDPANTIFYRQRKIKLVPEPKDGRKKMRVTDEDFKKILTKVHNLNGSEKKQWINNSWDEQFLDDFYDFLIYLRYTGIRDRALLNMMWKVNINFISEKIFVPEWMGKERTGSYEIFIDGRIFDSLVQRKLNRKNRAKQVSESLLLNSSSIRRANQEELQERLQKAEGHLFPDVVLRGGQCFYLKCNSFFKWICRELDLKNYNLHDLRRAAAQEWYEKSGDIVKVSKALGHRTIEMTEEYLDIDSPNFDSLFNPIEPSSHRPLNAVQIPNNTNSSLQ